MALKNIDQLIAEIDLAVHPDGPLGKTTAPGLNALLRSLALELTTSAATQPQLTDVVQLTTNQRVAGTKTFTDQLVLSQQAAQAKGILITGDEVYDETYTSESGVRIAVGVNRDGNRQLWIGDDGAYGQYDKGVLRYQTGTRLPRIDAVSGDGDNRMNIAIGTGTSNVAIGGEEQHPSERLEVFGNVKADQFIGDGSLLTGIGQVAVEQAKASSPVLFVQHYGQTTPGQRGSVAQPFPTIQAAIDAALPQDTIFILPGGAAVDNLGRRCYDEPVSVHKNVAICGLGTVVCSGSWLIPQYPFAYESFTISIKGLIFRNYVALVVPKGGTLNVSFEQCEWEELGYVFSFLEASGAPQPGPDVATFSHCRFRSTQPVGGPGNFRFQGRDDAGYTKDVIIRLQDCELSSSNTPLMTGYCSIRQRVYLQGRTTLVPGNGHPIISTTRVNSSVPLLFSELFTDERSGNAGSTIATLPELVITQGGAQAFQLPTGASGVLGLTARAGDNGEARTLYAADCVVTDAVLTIAANAALQPGERLSGSYYYKFSTQLAGKNEFWEDEDPRFVYTGPWYREADSDTLYRGGAGRYADPYSDVAVEFSFTGQQFTIWAESHSDLELTPNVNLFVDGGRMSAPNQKINNPDSTYPNNKTWAWFTSPVLPYGTHTVRFASDPAAGGYIVFDGVQIVPMV